MKSMVLVAATRAPQISEPLADFKIGAGQDSAAGEARRERGAEGRKLKTDQGTSTALIVAATRANSRIDCYLG